MTKEREGSHSDLVTRYDDVLFEQSSEINDISYNQVENENVMLKDLVEKLKVEYLALLEKHYMLLCSHEKLIDDHIILNVAHEIVIANLIFLQPHKCTCIHFENILPCANPCCSKEIQSSIE